MAAKKSGGAAATVDTSKVRLSDRPGKADTAGLTQDKLTGASSSDMDASGAFQEPEIKDRIDVGHPAVDNNPRAGQPKVANQIDFNDPAKRSDEAVADNMKAQQGR
ncbi:MAG: hypothetical protein ACXW27_09075 [Allosphingosinicella sp.]